MKIGRGRRLRKPRFPRTGGIALEHKAGGNIPGPRRSQKIFVCTLEPVALAVVEVLNVGKVSSTYDGHLVYFLYFFLEAIVAGRYLELCGVYAGSSVCEICVQRSGLIAGSIQVPQNIFYVGGGETLQSPLESR